MFRVLAVFSIISSTVLYSSCQEYDCSSNDIFLEAPEKCVYYECTTNVSGMLRPCPPGSAVPPRYKSGTAMPCTELDSKCSLCSHFPSDFLYPATWYFGRVDLDQGRHVYWRQIVTNTSIILETGQYQQVYLCIDQTEVAPEFGSTYTVALWKAPGSSQLLLYQCLQTIQTDNDQLVLQKQGPLSTHNYTLDECRDILESVRWYRVLFPYPDNMTSFSLPKISCPIPEGEYQMTLDVDGSRTRLCGDDPRSKVTVSGSQFIISYCANASGARYTYTCHYRLDPRYVDDPDDTNGRIVLISRAETDPNQPQLNIMCMRYYVDGDKVYLSVAINNNNTIECASNVTYQTYGKFDDKMEGATAYRLTALPTSGSPLRSTALSTASSMGFPSDVTSEVSSPGTGSFPQITELRHTETSSASDVTEVTTAVTDVTSITGYHDTQQAVVDSSSSSIVIIIFSLIVLLLIVTIATIVITRRGGCCQPRPTWLPYGVSHLAEDYSTETLWNKRSNKYEMLNRHINIYNDVNPESSRGTYVTHVQV